MRKIWPNLAVSAAMVLSCASYPIAAAAVPLTYYSRALTSDGFEQACDSGQDQGTTAHCAQSFAIGVAGQPNYVSTTASSTASLANGVMYASAAGSGCFYSICSSGAAAAITYDTLTFHGAITPGDLVTISMSAQVAYDPTHGTGSDSGVSGVIMNMMGSATNYGYYGSGSPGELLAQALDCSPTAGGLGFLSLIGVDYNTECPIAEYSYDRGNYEISNNGDLYTLFETFDLSSLLSISTEASLALYMEVDAAAVGNSSATITDPIVVSLPAGITYTTASGFLLGGSPSPVPEPTTLSIFGLGLAGLGFMLRRRMRT